jgi:hypothetical protein
VVGLVAMYTLEGALYRAVWGVDALTAGLGFLFMAALEPRLRRIAGLRLHQS